MPQISMTTDYKPDIIKVKSLWLQKQNKKGYWLAWKTAMSKLYKAKIQWHIKDWYLFQYRCGRLYLKTGFQVLLLHRAGRWRSKSALKWRAWVTGWSSHSDWPTPAERNIWLAEGWREGLFSEVSQPVCWLVTQVVGVSESDRVSQASSPIEWKEWLSAFTV